MYAAWTMPTENKDGILGVYKIKIKRSKKLIQLYSIVYFVVKHLKNLCNFTRIHIKQGHH